MHKEHSTIILRERRNTPITDHNQFQELIIKAMENMVGKMTITNKINTNTLSYKKITKDFENNLITRMKIKRNSWKSTMKHKQL